MTAAPRDPRRALALAVLLARTSAEAAALPGPALAAVRPVLAQVRAELRRAAQAWREDGDPAAPLTPARHGAALRRLAAVVAALALLRAALAAAFGRLRTDAARRALRHVERELVDVPAALGVPARPVALDLPPVLAAGERALAARHAAAAAGYAQGVGDDVRRELALAALRGATVAEASDALAALGGAPPPAGVAPDPTAAARARRYDGWLERLVVTEAAAAYGAHATLALGAAARLAPGVARRWDASLDARVCPACADLDGEVAAPGALFSNGLDGPPAHPRCRCRVGAWRAEWDDAAPAADDSRAPPPPPPTPLPVERRTPAPGHGG